MSPIWQYPPPPHWKAILRNIKYNTYYIFILLLKIIIKILYFLVTKLMTRVAGLTGLKLAPRSLSSNKRWASGDEMAKEASESDDYFGGTFVCG